MFFFQTRNFKFVTVFYREVVERQNALDVDNRRTVFFAQNLAVCHPFEKIHLYLSSTCCHVTIGKVYAASFSFSFSFI